MKSFRFLKSRFSDKNNSCQSPWVKVEDLLNTFLNILPFGVIPKTVHNPLSPLSTNNPYLDPSPFLDHFLYKYISLNKRKKIIFQLVILNMPSKAVQDSLVLIKPLSDNSLPFKTILKYNTSRSKNKKLLILINVRFNLCEFLFTIRSFYLWIYFFFWKEMLFIWIHNCLIYS